MNLPFSPKQQKLPSDSTHLNIVRTRVFRTKIKTKQCVLQTGEYGSLTKQGGTQEEENATLKIDSLLCVQVSEKFIEGALHSHEPVIVNEELFVRAVIALGETALLAPNTVKSDTIKHLGRVIDPISDREYFVKSFSTSCVTPFVANPVGAVG